MRDTDWVMVRDDWMQRRLTGEHVSWVQLARDHGRNSETIRKAARRQGCVSRQPSLDRLGR
jgi:hypothetical protein